MAAINTIPASSSMTYVEGIADVDTKYVSKVTLPNGDLAYIKDALARQTIANIKEAIDGGTHFLGVTTTALTDGATTSPITINGESVTPSKGDFVIVAKGGDSEPYIEFIWTGTQWTELGSTGSLKALAYKDTASATYTPEGTVTGTYTPAGTIAASFTPAGTVTGTFTPAGTVTGTFTPAGSVAGTFTPEGSITITPTYVTGFVASISYTAGDEALAFTFDSTTNLISEASATFSGTQKSLDSAVFTGTQKALDSAAFTATAQALDSAVFTGTKGAITDAVFTGTTKALDSASFSGTTATITVS